MKCLTNKEQSCRCTVYFEVSFYIIIQFASLICKVVEYVYYDQLDLNQQEYNSFRHLTFRKKEERRRQ